MTTPREFSTIVAACEALLQTPDAASWIAAPALHVLSGHPTHFDRYRDALAGAGPGPRDHLADLARCVGRVGRGAAMSAPAITRCDVLLVGGVVHPDHLDRGEDFYFGNLQAALEARGVRSLHLVRNQTAEPTRDLALHARREGMRARLMLSDVARSASEARSWSRARAGVQRLRRAAAALDAPAGLVAEGAAADVASIMGNLALEEHVADACRRSGARVVIAMYEGHAWERCVWRGARRASPGITCVGYQHTVLRQHSHAIRRRVRGGADPDLVLCLGDVTRGDLERAPGLAGTRFAVLGTHRRDAPAREAAAPTRRTGCIVLPEGLPGEALRLFETAAAAARRAPTVPFIFRSHPILPYERVAAGSPSLASLPGNVEVSVNRSLTDDLERCGRILYRGSSTAIYGILAGLKPYYLTNDHELTLDPLYMLERWRDIVATDDALVAAFEADAARADDERATDWRAARDFCSMYAVSEQPAAFDQLAALARGGG